MTDWESAFLEVWEGLQNGWRDSEYPNLWWLGRTTVTEKTKSKVVYQAREILVAVFRES